MGWQVIAKAEPKKAPAVDAPVRMAGTFGQKNRNPQLMLLLRPAKLAGAATWCKAGASVSVARGTGSNAGKIRLAAGKDFVLGATPGTIGSAGSLVLRLTGYEFWTPAKRTPEPVAFEWDGTGLIVTLPAWAREDATVEPAAANSVPPACVTLPPPPKPAQKGFRVGDRDGMGDVFVHNGGLPGGGVR